MLAFFVEHEALLVTEYFFVHEGVPTLALLVRYRERLGSTGAGRSDVRRVAEEATVQVGEPDRALFEALRGWRNGRARKDGKPAYVLFTNAQLAAIARVRPRSRAALEEVDGVGSARVRDYAEEVLAVVAGVPLGAATEEGGADAQQPVAGP